MPKKNRELPAEAAKIRREAEEMVERLRRAVTLAAHKKRVSHRELARRTARAPDYWTKLFNGQRELHASHVFQVLLAVDAAPGDFLAEVFPPESASLGMGADLMAGLIGLGKALREGLTLEELVGLMGSGSRKTKEQQAPAQRRDRRGG
jgi:hypothetical protein